mgnify:CR=1 FL=1
MANRLRISLALMLISIILIVAFQSWWLRKSYREEAETLRIRTNFIFRESLFELQVSKFRLDTGAQVRMPMNKNAVGMINVLKTRLRDSLMLLPKAKGKMILSIDKKQIDPEIENAAGQDTGEKKAMVRYSQGSDQIFEVLLSSDSLQDSLKVQEVHDAFEKKLLSQNISVPFEIERTLLPLRRDGGFVERDDEQGVTVGFLNPMTFKPVLLNTTPYLLKQISPQLLFSLFLLGVVIISFLSLYKNLLAQQKLAGIKNEFISNITHELKTPIATVSVAIEALRNFNALHDPSKTREYLDISQNELQRLSLLVDKVLKLSMFEKKEIELKIEPVDLKTLVDEVVSSMRLQFEKFNAHVSVDVQGNSYVQGDKLHLISIIFNLLDNALKYAKGNPSIQILISEEPEVVQLSVTDNGIGIPTQYKDKIFEKFFRVPSGDKHDAKGYGLGLSYVLHVVKKHKGEILVDSQPGIGSRFTIKFPKTHE